MTGLVVDGSAARKSDLGLRPQPPGARILNPVSGSRASTRATIAAARMASELRAELIVVHVAAPGAVRVCRLGPSIARVRRLDDPYASPVLLEAHRVAWSHGALARIVLMDGAAVSAILTVAEEFEVDAIVIGASSARAPTILSARTGWQLQRRSRRPVMPVPAHRQGRKWAIRTTVAT